MELVINGFPVRVTYTPETVTNLFLPLLRQWTSLCAQRAGRVFVCLAAPPGAGKSTLAAYLERLSEATPGLEPLQALGIDGFHYPAAYIAAHTVERNGQTLPMQAVKGCPETFDAPKLLETVRAAKHTEVLWPVYDRTLHDVVENVLPVRRKLCLLEGNWLLLGTPPWPAVRAECAHSVFLHAQEETLRPRLVERKMRGGLTQAEADAFYINGDGPNVRRCLAESLPADVVWQWVGQGIRLATP